MKKFFLKILLFFCIIYPNFANAADDYDSGGLNVKINTYKSDYNTNTPLEKLNENGKFFNASKTGEEGLRYLLLNIARDAKVLIYAIVILLGVIVVMKLIFSKGGDDDFKKLKRWILRASVGIIVIQTASVAANVLFNQDVNSTLAKSLNTTIVYPFIRMLYTISSFVFIFVAIIAFYKIITGGDDGVKKGKQSIVSAIIGFIVIKFAYTLTKNTFDPTCDTGTTILFGGTSVCQNITDNAKIATVIINWINGFLGIVIILFTIYAGYLYITSGGAEDKQKKAKNILLYITIGVILLTASYLILTFFINK